MIPPKENAAFVGQMEEVLDAYEQPYDKMHPLVCFDEKPVQLLGHSIPAIPAKPGQLEREDHEYVRMGTACILGFFEPLTGFRSLMAKQRRTAQDFAHEMKRLVDVLYPNAERIRVVLDNLNTHTKASLYATFPPAVASRIAKKLQFIYTPKHGSWLNAIEIEFSVLQRQCLERRVDTLELLESELSAWQNQRNHAQRTVEWHFTSLNARAKLKHLYPVISLHPE